MQKYQESLFDKKKVTGNRKRFALYFKTARIMGGMHMASGWRKPAEIT
jgi:hypothetical protein